MKCIGTVVWFNLFLLFILLTILRDIQQYLLRAPKGESGRNKIAAGSDKVRFFFACAVQLLPDHRLGGSNKAGDIAYKLWRVYY